MSVTTSVPSNANPEAFASIFSQKKQQKSRQNDVIYTLSSAVDAIEGGLPKTQHATEANDLRAAVTQASSSNAEPDMSHLDGVPMQDLRVSIQEFAKRLRPFNPPPAPVPMGEGELSESAEANPSATETASSEPSERSYSTVLTIRESTHTDGHRTYEAHTTPLVPVENVEAPSAHEGEATRDPSPTSDSPSRFLERMRIRQLRYEDFRSRRNQERMQAISVKRQRKLKMKKHKHKKLLRKTRTLRRRLDKA